MFLLPPPAQAQHTLPPFRNLLIKGQYAPSSPIHLCISHLDETRATNILFLTPSREAFATALQDFNDDWLLKNAATCAYARLLSKLDIFYPSSAAHWLLLLASLKPVSRAGNSKLAVLPHVPTLIVLHEPSEYFLSQDTTTPHELPQYLQLITAALSAAAFLSSGNPVPIVLFDSQLSNLRLPVTRPLSPARRLFSTDAEEAIAPVRQERVERFVEKYFDVIGTVKSELDEQHSLLTQVPRTPPPQGTFDMSGDRKAGQYRLLLVRKDSEESTIVKWTETRTRTRTVFEFR